MHYICIIYISQIKFFENKFTDKFYLESMIFMVRFQQKNIVPICNSNLIQLMQCILFAHVLQRKFKGTHCIDMEFQIPNHIANVNILRLYK